MDKEKKKNLMGYLKSQPWYNLIKYQIAREVWSEFEWVEFGITEPKMMNTPFEDYLDKQEDK